MTRVLVNMKVMIKGLGFGGRKNLEPNLGSATHQMWDLEPVTMLSFPLSIGKGVIGVHYPTQLSLGFDVTTR